MLGLVLSKLRELEWNWGGGAVDVAKGSIEDPSPKC
jgi:hypothetical protein